MLLGLSRSELLDALAFYEIDPPGQRRADMRAMASGLLASGNCQSAPNMIYPYFGASFDEELEAEAFIDELIASKSNATPATSSIEPSHVA